MSREEDLLVVIRELVQTFERTARQTFAKLEQKSAELKLLIAQADVRLAEMRKRQDSPSGPLETTASVPVVEANPGPVAPPEPIHLPTRSEEEKPSQTDAGRKLGGPALSLSKPLPERVGREERAQLLGRTSTPAPEKMGLDPSLFTDKHKKVYQLAEEGLNVEEIAARTKIGKGEVMLILSLRERQP